VFNPKVPVTENFKANQLDAMPQCHGQADGETRISDIHQLR